MSSFEIFVLNRSPQRIPQVYSFHFRIRYHLFLKGFADRQLDSYVFAEFQTSLKPDAINSTYSRSIPTFLTLYIFGFLFQLILVYDALNLKNTIQIIGLCMFNLALLVYAAVQMDQIKDAVLSLVAQVTAVGPDIDISVWETTKPFLVAIPCVLALGTFLMSIVAWKLYDEFAWTIYKHISADLKMKRRYLTFQVCSIPRLLLRLLHDVSDQVRPDLYCSSEI